MMSDTAFLTTRVRLTVNEDTREVRRLTPATQTSCVKTFKPRIRYAVGMGEGNGRDEVENAEVCWRVYSCSVMSPFNDRKIGIERKWR